MWDPSIPWWEHICRAVVVYIFLLVILRITGKRQVGQLAPFDLVLLLVLSNAVQNAMNGGDNSITGGIVLSTTLIALNSLVSLATFKFKRLESFIEGRPQILIHNGQLDELVMHREKITHHELMSALRAAGCANVEQVHFAILENNGQITVQARKHTNDNS